MGFNDDYRGSPPWDTGRPQPEFVNLGEDEVRGSVIDVGCGTGEHSILFASRGHRTLGVDTAPLAIERAKAKTRDRNSTAEFEIADALELASLGRSFDTGIDSGLFHNLSDTERPLYARSLGSVIKSGGRMFILSFSDREPLGWGGPRRVSEREIRETFAQGWHVNYIRPAIFEITIHGGKAQAIFCSLTRSSIE